MALPAVETQETHDVILSPEEGRALFERESWRLAGMSGAEFLRRLDAGEFNDLEDVPENWNILRLSMLTGFAHREP